MCRMFDLMFQSMFDMLEHDVMREVSAGDMTCAHVSPRYVDVMWKHDEELMEGNIKLGSEVQNNSRCYTFQTLQTLHGVLQTLH